ncbi:TPA: SPOR domain-containing protein [Photobacterium damselae]|uniref:SPOR domain-containing protein n=1 Tax=Photobacterium damselae TaxID=38293 RepID=UPI001302D5DB|nr:SPOR domain-containing protein [Photobacterium damselae]MBA5682487.1 SPOR domain-containing protein [Photobacterium damselae subsp. damselae]MDC4170199.1 SPOR domain-containing protein [Photobacterium damselae]
MKLLSRKTVPALLASILLAGCSSADNPCDTGYLMPSKINGDNFQCQQPETTAPETDYNDQTTDNTVTEEPAITEDNSVSSDEAYGSFDPSHYTVQVLALKRESDLHNYISLLPTNEPVWVNWNRVEGQSWFVVIMGDYPSREAARQAIGYLPSQVQAQGPFIRSFANVQADKETNVVRMR